MRKSVIAGTISVLLLSGAAFAQVPPLSGGPVPDQLDTQIPATPSTTHTQAAATILQGTINPVSPANAADAVSLPLCTRAPRRITVVDTSAANAVQVYAQGTDTIDTTAGSTGVSQAAQAVTEYLCTKVSPGGVWRSH